MNQFVLDTNLLISAHLLRHSQSRKAFGLAFEKGLVLRSNETLEEFAATFIHPKFDKYISLESRLKAISEFESRSFLIEVTHNITASRDSKDDKFLSLAFSAGADYIITGDTDLLVLHPFKKISIISPSEFLNGK